MDDVSGIAFFWKPWREITGNASHFFKNLPASLCLLKGGSENGQPGFFERVSSMNSISTELRRKFQTKKEIPVYFIEHHLAHAASAFWASPFKESAILTIDGRGESTTTLLSTGNGSQIEKIREVFVPHSLGHLYASVTAHLGFEPFFDEWKVMGMAAYGRDTYLNSFKKLVHFDSDGIFSLDLTYFSFQTHGQKRWLSEKFSSEFGPPRMPFEEIKQSHYDLAFALQRIIEVAGLSLAKFLRKYSKSDNLSMAGGVALNCLMNAKIVKESGFKNFFFQPIANDAGASIGAALYHYYQTLKNEFQPKKYSIYLGPSFSDQWIEVELTRAQLHFKRTTEIEAETAALIAKGKIVAWFQGKMESGPRALGNRSITVDPTRVEMREKLNQRIKKREEFRPFAPAVLAESASDYFELPGNLLSPHMMLIANVREEKKNILPAVTHADGTARVQTVTQEDNPRFWKLIKEFEKITGVPVLLNTSFNEREPIVCTPEEAIACFKRNEIEVLAIGNFIVEK